MEYSELREEVQRLRDWRHDFLNEWFAAKLWEGECRTELGRLGKIVDALDVKVEAIIDLSKRQTAVAEALAARGHVLPVGWITKAVALAVSLSAIGSFVLLATRKG